MPTSISHLKQELLVARDAIKNGDLDAAANALLDLLIVSSDKRNKPFSSRDVDKFLKISKKIDIVNDIVLFQRFEGKATNLMGDTYETYGNEVLFAYAAHDTYFTFLLEPLYPIFSANPSEQNIKDMIGHIDMMLELIDHTCNRI